MHILCCHQQMVQKGEETVKATKSMYSQLPDCVNDRVCVCVCVCASGLGRTTLLQEGVLSFFFAHHSLNPSRSPSYYQASIGPSRSPYFLDQASIGPSCQYWAFMPVLGLHAILSTLRIGFVALPVASLLFFMRFLKTVTLLNILRLANTTVII